jgi:hypothetical protein
LTVPSTIGEVIGELTAIVDWAKSANSRLGYFPALYRKVTMEVQRGIVSGTFEDGPRMERLDVVFARRYFDAFNDWRAGKPVPNCWQLAFEAGARRTPVIMQHLLAGMNAHINFDLGIATADMTQSTTLSSLRKDFDKISDILCSMTLGIEKALASTSPWIGLMTFVDDRTPEQVANFNLRIARNLAWQAAERFAASERNTRSSGIADLDFETAVIGRLLLRPGPLLRTGFLVMRIRETAEPRAIIDALSKP